MELLAKYKNGNYTVKLFDDGTKIRYNNLDNLTPTFPESIDISITERCNGNCNFCYLGCTEQGKHGNLNHSILDTVCSGMELAINANDLSHPDLENFLIKMKDKGVIVNMTINQKHLSSNLKKLKTWQDNRLIYGIGISLNDSTDTILWNNGLKNTVIHVIDGCFTKEDLENLADKNVKLLILGYKIKGRGVEYYRLNQKEIEDNIDYLDKNIMSYRSRYNGIAYDTLATIHLHMQDKVSKKQWELHNMGEEGEFTMFLDLVNNQYSISSLDTDVYDINENDTIYGIFHKVRQYAGHE